MRDDEFDRKLAEVEEIINRLNQGNVTLEEGERLKQRAADLLEELEALLDQGNGETMVVELNGEEIDEGELRL